MAKKKGESITDRWNKEADEQFKEVPTPPDILKKAEELRRKEANKKFRDYVNE